ncbi:integrase [Ectothiorhodospira haloalkaliphila]|uniref:Integrase n=1 Tax=Ectothiorhodospira haloalkaliphila TaxID=421628 RepID=W8KML1_9GAMM|nr:integrase [Ectothiorhodospira haloalkaliphila]
MKSEWLAGQRYLNREQARQDIVQYIETEYNSDRLHSSLGYITPQQHFLAVAA